MKGGQSRTFQPRWWRKTSAEAITFLMKDVVLLAVSFNLLKQDLARVSLLLRWLTRV
jgi:hypothetical protein